MLFRSKERAYDQWRLKGGEIEKVALTEITGREKNKLFPTDIGILVNDFLVENFGKIIDFNFTANVEQQFDEIAQGGKEWKKMISSFYTPFHENVEDTLENSARITGERLLGIDPKSGKNIYVRMGRFGAMAQIGETPKTDDDEKPKYSGLRKGQSLSFSYDSNRKRVMDFDILKGFIMERNRRGKKIDKKFLLEKVKTTYNIE